MTLGWIDFSTQDRQRIEAALNRLTPRGTLDELGLGQIRDGLANHLFPGTSTLHTRAVYFLLVPQLLREIAAKPGKKGVREVVQQLYQKEFEAIGHLVSNDEAGVAWGIIGKTAGKALKQKPSGAYWSGIRQFGLVENYGSLRQFVARCLPHWRQGDADFGFAALSQQPRPAGDWLAELNVRLDAKDAAFLRTQIKRTHANSLFASLLRLAEHEEADVLEVDHAPDFFDHPALSVHAGYLRHSRTYEMVCRSALLAYNLALRVKTERMDNEDETTQTLHAAHITLYGDVERWRLQPIDVDNLLAAFPRSDNDTAIFLRAWSQRLLTRTDQGMEALEVIEEREYRMKGARARLHDLSRAEALAPNATPGLSWASGNGTVNPVFDYRWPTVKNHLHDLTVGIRKAHA
jgi:hypothetical protein